MLTCGPSHEVRPQVCCSGRVATSRRSLTPRTALVWSWAATTITWARRVSPTPSCVCGSETSHGASLKARISQVRTFMTCRLCPSITHRPPHYLGGPEQPGPQRVVHGVVEAELHHPHVPRRLEKAHHRPGDGIQRRHNACRHRPERTHTDMPLTHKDRHADTLPQTSCTTRLCMWSIHTTDSSIGWGRRRHTYLTSGRSCIPGMLT